MPTRCHDRCLYPERLGETLGIEVKSCLARRIRYPCHHYSACATCEIMLTSYPMMHCPCCGNRLRRKYFPNGGLTSRARRMERNVEIERMVRLMEPREPNRCVDCGVDLMRRTNGRPSRCGPHKRAHDAEWLKNYQARRKAKRLTEAVA